MLNHGVRGSMADILDFESDVENLPQPDELYRAFGLCRSPSIALSFLFAAGGGVTYPYARLIMTEFESAGEAANDIIVLRFDAAARVEVLTVEGRALYPLWRQLSEHRAVWIRERSEGGRLDGGAAVTAITRASEPVNRPLGLRRP